MIIVLIAILAIGVLAELILILSLARLVGKMMVRMGPSGVGALATPEGLELGESVIPFQTTTVSGDWIEVPLAGTATLAVFLRLTSCDTCQAVVEHVIRISKSYRDIVKPLVITNSDHLGGEEAISGYAEKLAAASIPLCVDNDIFERFEVKTVPYGFLVGLDGEVKAKGIINSLEHVESLLEAAELGHDRERQEQAEVELVSVKNEKEAIRYG